MPIEPTYVTKTEAALRSIRERIHSGELPAGAHLQVKDLAAELGMSHTPVREALRVLSADGLVDFRNHRGAVVAETSKAVEEVWHLRALLEPEAVRRAVPLPAETLARIERLHARVHEGNVLQRSMQNQEWHFAIYEACASPILLSFIRRLWELIPWRTVWWLPGRVDVSTEEHDAIMEALRAEDGNLAAERMHAHLLSALHAVLKLPETVDAEASGAPPKRADNERGGQGR